MTRIQLYSDDKDVLEDGNQVTVWSDSFSLLFIAASALPDSILQHKRRSRKHIAVVRASCSVECILKVSVTIFAAATTFSGSVGRGQSLAIRSWLGLSQNIRVVLFSQEPSVFSFASSSGLPLASIINRGGIRTGGRRGMPNMRSNVRKKVDAEYRRPRPSCQGTWRATIAEEPRCVYDDKVSINLCVRSYLVLIKKMQVLLQKNLEAKDESVVGLNDGSWFWLSEGQSCWKQWAIDGNIDMCDLSYAKRKFERYLATSLTPAKRLCLLVYSCCEFIHCIAAKEPILFALIYI
ncbi:hypothetical protein Tco_0801932 [Tanacetum coccineum]|uniref:Uncharacterized protein n=1 Tax=Tanacetum coccineum TaxID=301880 RepID=A0ABQ4ZXC4_9ASTR